MALSHRVEIELVTFDVLDQLIAKIQHASADPAMKELVARWLDEHDFGSYEDDGHSFVVVGDELMFLHPCPDGVLLPFAADPLDGHVRAYVDPAHNGESFL